LSNGYLFTFFAWLKKVSKESNRAAAVLRVSAKVAAKADKKRNCSEFILFPAFARTLTAAAKHSRVEQVKGSIIEGCLLVI
jgi:hypothetical protein